MHGIRVLSYVVEAFGTELFFLDYVYGSYECKDCHDFRGHLKLYGNWSSHRSNYLGKYAVLVRKSIDDRILVDHSDSRTFSCCDSALPDKYRKCLQGAGKPQGK